MEPKCERKPIYTLSNTEIHFSFILNPINILTLYEQEQCISCVMKVGKVKVTVKVFRYNPDVALGVPGG